MIAGGAKLRKAFCLIIVFIMEISTHNHPRCGDHNVSGCVGIEERIAVKVDGKGPMRIAMYE